MRMHDLEDRLHQLADPVSAPPGTSARAAIMRRATVLRRRRRALQATGASVVMVLAVAAGTLLRQGGGDGQDVELGPVTRDEGSLPALTVDLDGWEVVSAEDDVQPQVSGSDQSGGSMQVFTNLSGQSVPLVIVQHEVVADPASPAQGAEQVDLCGTTQADLQRGAGIRLRWDPQAGDSLAELHAWGLSEEDAVDFACSLQPKSTDISYPGTETPLGFVVGEVPDSWQEVPLESDRPDGLLRRSQLQPSSPGDDQQLSITISVGNPGPWLVEDAFVDSWAVAGETVEVMGQDGLLRPIPEGAGEADGWVLTWLRTDQVAVSIRMEGLDRQAVDDVIDGLRELTNAEWQDLTEPT